MAEPVSATMTASRLRRAALLLLAAATQTAMAQPLADPTRPPVAHGATSVESGAGAAAPVLQSVLIAPGRSEAIISGQTVRLGEKFGDARLVRITESEVTLRNGKDVQTLKLFPNIEKKPTQSRSNAKPRRRDEEKQGRE